MGESSEFCACLSAREAANPVPVGFGRRHSFICEVQDHPHPANQSSSLSDSFIKGYRSHGKASPLSLLALEPLQNTART